MGETIVKNGKVEVIRRSDVECLRECPLHFKKKVLDKEPQITNIYALHGIILHDLAYQYTNRQINQDEMKEQFLEQFSKISGEPYNGYNEDILKYTLIEKGLKCIENLIIYHHESPLLHSSEEDLVLELGEDYPAISITYDRANILEDGFEMLDYKMGKVFTGTKLYTDLQLPLYTLAWEQKYGELPKKFSFIFLSENKERVYEYIGNREYKCIVRKREYIVNVDVLLLEAKKTLKHINKRTFQKNTNLPLHICKRCPYKCVNLNTWLEVSE